MGILLEFLYTREDGVYFKKCIFSVYYLKSALEIHRERKILLKISLSVFRYYINAIPYKKNLILDIDEF